MNEFSMTYRRGTTESISQVSVTYYHKNHPKNIPIVDMKYDGTDILKIYSNTNVVVENNKYTQLVENNINDEHDGLRDFLHNTLNDDINMMDGCMEIEFSLFIIFTYCKRLLNTIDKKFGVKKGECKKSKHD
nr:MAG TPA: hypothetical protein [Caudoviricetes sp.]